MDSTFQRHGLGAFEVGFDCKPATANQRVERTAARIGTQLELKDAA